MAISLSRGQCAATAGSIYACPASTKTSIKTIILFNSNTITETVKIYTVPNNAGALGTASASNQILSISLTSGNTFEFSPAYPIEMNALNDAIFAESTTGNKVNYLINGGETSV